MVRDVHRQALHFKLPHDKLEDASLILDPFGYSHRQYRHTDLQGIVHCDSQEVGVQQGLLDGMELPLLQHDAGCPLILDVEREDRIVSGAGVQDSQQVLGVHGQGERRFPLAVEHGGYPAMDSHLARGVLAETGPDLS